MWSDTIQVPFVGDRELFLEVLRTLPTPVERSGELELIATSLVPSNAIRYLEVLQKSEIIPGLRIRFAYDSFHKAFIPTAEMDRRLTYTGNDLRSSSELEAVTKAVLSGGRPHIYQIEMAGFGSQFTYEDLQQQFLRQISSSFYPITRGKLTLGTSPGYDRGAWTVTEELFLQRGSVTISSNYGKPARLAKWFAALKQEYTPKKKL